MRRGAVSFSLKAADLERGSAFGAATSRGSELA